ncbi:MAG: carboxypeptidase-like regulatory domain-containing protein [Vulcanimicrobiota bacterium]
MTKKIIPYCNFALVFMLIFIMTLSGCGGGGGGGTAGGGGTGGSDQTPTTQPVATYGPSTDTQVNVGVNGVVEDQTTGMTFFFPNGGSGTLTTAKATSVTGSPCNDYIGFKVTYSGNEAVSIRLDNNSEDEYCFYAWGTFETGNPTARWFPIPPRSSEDGYLYVDLQSPASVTGQNAKKSKTDVGKLYVLDIVRTIMKKNNDDSLKKKILAKIDEYKNNALNSMSQDLQNRIRQEIDRNPLRVIWQDSESCYYDGFTWYQGITLVREPKMMLNVSENMVDSQTVSHEYGHYITHLLMNDTLFYRTVQAGSYWFAAHEPGVLMGRNYGPLEDYAHYLQWLEVGWIGTSSTLSVPTNIATFFKTHPPHQLGSDQTFPLDPGEIDIPQLEGIFAILMAYCTHSDPNNIKDFSGVKTPCPAIGANPGALLEAYTEGEALRNGLWRSINGVVNRMGHKDAFTVISERCGWSYHISGLIKNSNGDPVQGVTVTNIFTADGVEYTTPNDAQQSVTDNNGEYILHRTFPGKSQLKLTTSDGSTIKKDIEVPLTQLTTERTILPVIILETTPTTRPIVTGFTASPQELTSPPEGSYTFSVSVSGGKPPYTVTWFMPHGSTQQYKYGETITLQYSELNDNDSYSKHVPYSVKDSNGNYAHYKKSDGTYSTSFEYFIGTNSHYTVPTTFPSEP